MNRRRSALIILLLSTSLFACAKSDSATGPTTVSGTYHGAAGDNTGTGFLTLQLSQSGSTVTGTATTSSSTGATGLTGIGSGTLSGSTLTFTITVTTDDQPPCNIVFSGTATGVTSSTIDGTYTATSSCGGSLTGGTFTLTKQ